MAKKKDNPDALKPWRDSFEKIAQLREKDFKRYKDDIRFLYVDHWDAATRAERDRDKRLTLQVDKLLQYRHQVVNDSRMNRPQIKVSPVTGGAQEVAEIYDGLIRSIQDRSNADAAYDTALGCSADGGFGFIRLNHEYAHEGTADQEICIESVPNPLQVYFGHYTKPDGSDVREVFVCEDVPKEEFKEEWPDVEMTDWGTEGRYGDWIGAETVRVAERFWIVKKQKILLILADGSTISNDDYQAAKAQMPIGMQMPAIMDQRKIKVDVVMWAKFCGSAILEEEQETVWSMIPVIIVPGNVQNIDGEVRHVSMIHNSKDAQLLYDYSRSAFAERVGMSPEASYVAAVGQTDTNPEEWDGSKRVAVRHYDPLDANGQALPPPKRDTPTDIPAGFAQDMQLSEHDIQGTLGMYQASLGKQGNATSGVQEREQARKGDVATFHYHDNLARALKVIGTLIVRASPKVYDTRRIIRTLGMDGTAEQARIDPRLPVPYKPGREAVYNLALGVYSVTVRVGPSYQTQRVEAAVQMADLATRDPNFMAMYGDLYFKAQDWPMAEDLAKRAKMLLPPQIQQAEENTEQSPEVQAAMAQVQQAMAQRDQALQALQAAQQEDAKAVAALRQQEASDQRDFEIKQAELKLKERDMLIKAFEAETERDRMKNDALQANQAAQQAAQPAQPAAPQQPIVINHDTSMKEGMEQMQQMMAQMMQGLQMIGTGLQRIEAISGAPRVKRATAFKRPDGGFDLESTETVQ